MPSFVFEPFQAVLAGGGKYPAGLPETAELAESQWNAFGMGRIVMREAVSYQ